MALRWKTRRRLACLILVVGLPVYILAAWALTGLIGRPSLPLELAIYVGLGVIWIVRFRGLFRGIGQAEPEAEKRRGADG
jgi:hypothetical protein